MTLASQHHQSPRPTPVSHERVCVLLCLVCLALDCGEICSVTSVGVLKRQFCSYKISPELRRISRRVSRRTLRRQTLRANFAAHFATKFRRECSPSARCYCCSASATFTMAAVALMCGVLGPCSLKSLKQKHRVERSNDQLALTLENGIEPAM